MVIGERLVSLRKNRGLTQRAVAEGIGVTVQTLWLLEVGRTPLPSAETVIKLADFYGVTTDYILGRKEVKE